MNLHGLSWTARLLEVANDRATSPGVYNRFTGGALIGCAIICDLQVLERGSIHMSMDFGGDL